MLEYHFINKANTNRQQDCSLVLTDCLSLFPGVVVWGTPAVIGSTDSGSVLSSASLVCIISQTQEKSEENQDRSSCRSPDAWALHL